MKRLALLRHAKSDWGDAKLDDHNRPLNERGWKAARRMGKELNHRGLQFDLVLASTAARVRETIDGLQEKFDFGCEIRFEPELYLASEETLLAAVQALPESVGTALLVGHNPGIQRLVVELTHDDAAGLRHRVAHKYPTGGFALIEFRVDDWSDVAPGSGEIAELILPKELD
jgi:phosphohistidine phosphatase